MRLKYFYLLFFLLISIKVYPQGYNLDIPFVNETLQPELFVLEPHYNSDNEVMYFTLGDLLRVEYKYNSAGLREKKYTYKWDDYDYLWELLNETTFGYDAQNKLIEEHTEQLFPKIMSRTEVAYPKTTILLKQIAHNPQQNIDTVIEYVNIPSLPTTSGRSDTTFSLRYLNDKGLADSAIYFFQHWDVLYRSKIDYTYDKRNRITSEKYFYSEDCSEWRLGGVLSVKYDKLKTTYDYAPVFDKNAYSQEEQEWEEYEAPKPICLEMGYDKQNRITSKQFKIGGRTFLSAKYSYDKYGQTNVEHEQQLNSSMLAYSGVVSGRLLDGFLYIKYKVQNEDRCRNAVYYLKNDNGKPVKVREVTNCYTPNGLLAVNDVVKYEKADGEFDERERVEFRYNSDGLSGEYISYRIWDKNDDIMEEPSRRLIFRNDKASEKRVFEENYRYSDAEKQWIPEDRKTKLYDENGYEAYWQSQRYDSYDKKWEEASSTKYVRDSLNRVLSEETNNTCYRYAYNRLHERTLKEKYVRKNKNAAWEGIYRDSTVYDSKGNTIEEIEYKWSDENAVWVPKWWVVDKSKDGNIEKITCKWEDDKWMPNKLQFHTYKNTDSIWITEKGFSQWDKTENNWTIHQLDRHVSSDDRKSRTEESYYWNTDLNELEGETCILEQYYASDFFKRKTYSLWNFNTKNWRDTIRHTIWCKEEKGMYNYHPIYMISSAEDSCVHIFENYCKTIEQWINNQQVEVTMQNDSVIQVVFSEWNLKNNTWGRIKKFLLYQDKNDVNYKRELFRYEKTTNRWLPLYKVENGEVAQRTGKTYSQWNEKAQQWNFLYFVRSSGYSTYYHNWDKETNAWKEESYWASPNNERNKIIENLSDDINIDYYSLRRINKEQFFEK